MLFNSYGFVFLFFPLTVLGYQICGRAGAAFRGGRYETVLKKGFLFVVSLIFYGWQSPKYLPVLLLTMAVNYGLSRLIVRSWERTARHRKILLFWGVAFNLSLLAGFKYLGNGSFVPLGVSFFTFTQIAYLAECCRENLQGSGVLSYGLYVVFFPKIMQGPIALPGEMLPQLEKVKGGISWERSCRSISLFVLGLFQKVLIADTLGKAVDFGYGNLAALNTGDGLIVMLSYTLQLYFDFSGYCDMAMGIAGLFGIELPLNFNSPYKAANILEFWKGWHITLTRFFTKYVYIPLGGNRKGKGRTYLNCLIVFFLSGLWHGTGWQFIVWGIMHGVLYVITRAWREIKDAKAAYKERGRVGRGICVLLTFLYVNAAWIFFRAPSMGDALSLLKTIGSFRFGRINWELAGCFNLDEFWYVIKVFGLDRWQYAHYILMALLLAALLGLVFFGENAVEYTRRIKPRGLHMVFMAVLFVWSVLSFSGVSSFLYVNF